MKMLIVDDELIIREGLSDYVKDNFRSIKLVPSATNGKEGLEHAKKYMPDIIITDIRMPLIDGLELISNLVTQDYDGEILILSGYDEFEYASQALKMGIRHYILKPCKNDVLKKEITQAIEDVKKRRSIAKYIKQYETDRAFLISQAKQQFLSDLIVSYYEVANNIDEYKKMFNLDGEKIRLVTVLVDDKESLYTLINLKKIIDDVLNVFNFSISLATGNTIVFIVGECSEKNVIEICNTILHIYNQYYMNHIYIAVSECEKLNDVPVAYKYVSSMLDYRFIDEKNFIITHSRLNSTKYKQEDAFVKSFAKEIANLITERKDVALLLEEFYSIAENASCEIIVFRIYCYELITRILNDLPMEYSQVSISYCSFNFANALQYKKCVTEKINEIASNQQNIFAHDYIKKSIDYIKANISDSDLTINKLSSDVIFLRADYLGKIFKQSTGYSIPTFIRNLRMDMAKNLLRQDEFKIFEISKMVGFEGDSHYFSTVFKKTTGYSPSDYRKTHGMEQTTRSSKHGAGTDTNGQGSPLFPATVS